MRLRNGIWHIGRIVEKPTAACICGLERTGLDEGELNLLDPDGKLAALFAEPEAEPPASSDYAVRPAAISDVADMETIERQAFPTLFPPTRFRRELQRSNTLYLLTVREWTQDELIHPVPDESDGSSGPLGLLKSIGAAPGKLLFSRIGSSQRKRSPQYIAGFVGLWFVLDEAHVVIIGNRPADRRKGLGELLLIAGIEAAMDRQSRVVTLEVRSSNEAARALYRKYGFQEVGVRKRYYADNNEDAVIMTTPPIQSDDYKEHFSEQVRNHAERWGSSERQIA